MFTKFRQILSRLYNAPPSNPPPSHSTPTLAQQVRELIAEAEISAALKLLIDDGYELAILLEMQRKEALAQFEQKLIDAESLSITHNRIVVALLEMIEPTKTTGANTAAVVNDKEPTENLATTLTDDQCQEMYILLLYKEHKKALTLAKDWSVDTRLLYQRYQSVIRDSRLGLVRKEEYDRIVQQIIQAAFALVSAGEMYPSLTDEQYQTLRQLIRKDQWSELFTLTSKWNKEFLMLSRRHHQLERDFSLGLITELDYDKLTGDIKQEIKKTIKE